jgi:hypothetical protein
VALMVGTGGSSCTQDQVQTVSHTHGTPRVALMGASRQIGGDVIVHSVVSVCVCWLSVDMGGMPAHDSQYA